MFWDFKFTVRNQNLPKCRIVAEFFYETPIRAFFRGFQTNCTTREQSTLLAKLTSALLMPQHLSSHLSSYLSFQGKFYSCLVMRPCDQCCRASGRALQTSLFTEMWTIFISISLFKRRSTYVSIYKDGSLM